MYAIVLVNVKRFRARCGFYAIENKLLLLFPRPCANAMLVSHTRAKKVTWRHSMIYVKHVMQFQLINSIVNRQHVNTLELIYTDMRSRSKVEKISHNFVL